MKCRTTNDCEQSCLPFFSACPLLDCHSKQKSCRQVSEVQLRGSTFCGCLRWPTESFLNPTSYSPYFWDMLLCLSASFISYRRPGSKEYHIVLNKSGGLGNIILLFDRRESSEERESRILFPQARPHIINEQHIIQPLAIFPLCFCRLAGWRQANDNPSQRAGLSILQQWQLSAKLRSRLQVLPELQG